MRKIVVVKKGRKELESGCELYEKGLLCEAFKQFQMAAKLGNPEAQVNLANMFDAGEGVEKDFKRAVYWYKRAVSHGTPEAAYNLAIAYKHQGHIRWFNFWLGRASNMGDEDAQEELAQQALSSRQ
jgi:uncharacterized protein